MTPIRIRSVHRAGLALLGIALVAVPVRATCGGGGGGGRGGAGQAYQTNWMSSWDKALADAARQEQGVLLYFQPATASEHRFFKTKWPNDASKERFFYKVSGTAQDAEKMRVQYGVQGEKKHFVFICDWYGNVFKTFKTTDRAKFRAGTMKGPLYGMRRSVKSLRRKIAQNAAKAEKALEKKSYPAAIKALQPARELSGYPEVEQSKALWQRVEKAGGEQLAEALRLEPPDRAKKLRALKRTFKGTAAGKDIAEALAKQEGKREASAGEGARDEATMKGPSLAERICDELFGDDGSETPEERVQAAFEEGLRHENAGRYEEALRAYERAVRLDPKDPVPLVYLGELHRHHLGRWTEAERAFRRVLELGGDDHAVAVALHGIGKMTIWRGDNEAGLKLLTRSIERRPTPLCYRNLAVYWNTEGDARKAFEYATKAYELEPQDSYNKVFYSVYLLLNGRADDAQRLMAAAEFDPSMSYNYACYHAVRGERDQVFAYLKRHFYEYEKFDAVRSFEMAEARMDGLFARWRDEPEFKRLTKLAGKTPWLRDG